MGFVGFCLFDPLIIGLTHNGFNSPVFFLFLYYGPGFLTGFSLSTSSLLLVPTRIS
jgi:hypothetical protein